MSLARRAARAALAASFVTGGLDQIRNPQPKAGPASPIAKPIADRVPQLPNDPESLVKLDGAIKVVGGLGLVFGPFARPAALLLAGSMVPTTLSGHRFWETTDPEQKVSDRIEFFKNVSLIGGLLSAALDTGGRPSIPWVAGKAAHGAAEAVGDVASTVGSGVSGAAGTVGSGVSGATGALAGAATAVGGAVASGAGKVSRRKNKKAAKASKRADALKVYAAAQAVKAAKVTARNSKDAAKATAKAGKQSAKAAKKAKNDGDVSRRVARAREAALTATSAAKDAALLAGSAAKEGAVAAKEKVGSSR
ncbi:MAG TPA: DoxX family protein [Mycobacteriales bacterium]